MVQSIGEPTRDKPERPAPIEGTHGLTPDESLALWHRWFSAMARGDIDGAWAISDAVLAARDPATRNDPAEPLHKRWVWDGRCIDGRDVLVRCYHGLGDTLQFARFLPRLRERARSLRVEAQPALIPLLRQVPGIDWLPFRDDAPLPPSECDIEIMEIAHALRAGPGTAAGPYLVPPPESVARIADALAGPLRRPAPLIGVCWRGGAWSNGRWIALDELARALPADAALVSLQGDDGADEADREPRLVNRAPLDIADAGAAIALVDLVITVDTMIAHLAGALGRPFWLLAPADCDWRWGRAGNRSAWYPKATLYRQITPGDWRPPLAALKADLAEWAAGAA